MSGILRIGLVDDEPPAIRRLRLALAEMPGVEVVGTAGDGAQALELIARGGLDVVLLDIRMPGLSGLDLLRAVPEEGAPVFIFVTAYSRFAAEAFELAAADYLLKPVEFERLRQAIARAREALASRAAAERIAELEKVVAAMKGAEAPRDGWINELWVPDRGERLRLPVHLIDWIEAERDYVRIHSRGRSFLLRKSIRDLEAELDPAHFVRVHPRGRDPPRPGGPDRAPTRRPLDGDPAVGRPGAGLAPAVVAGEAPVHRPAGEPRLGLQPAHPGEGRDPDLQAPKLMGRALSR